jgi:hypothetical protein
MTDQPPPDESFGVLGHRVGCPCASCVRVRADLRARRELGIPCTCTDPSSAWCELHEWTLCNG